MPRKSISPTGNEAAIRRGAGRSRVGLRLSAVLLAWLTTFHLVAAAERPNIILIVADDLGYGDLGCYGGTKARTPHLDQLAREGLRLTDFHANGSSCSPTRAALLTGRYQQRSGVDSALSEKSPGLRAGERTMATYLKAAGYATGVFGKWHLGSRPDSPALPNRQGFDEFRGARHGGVDYTSHVDRYGRRDWWHNEEPSDEEGYATELSTKHAVDFIERHRSEPFFLYLPHLAIHFPWMTAEDAAYRKPGGDYDNATKVGPHKPAEIGEVMRKMIESLDDGVGRVVETLRKLGLEKNTSIIFTSDNGGYVRYSGFFDISSNGVLKGQKIGLHEGGHRVPCIAWWPGRIAAGTESDALTMTMDLLPTFLDLVDVAPPPSGDPWAFDGVSLKPLLLRNEPVAARTLFWRAAADFKAVRSGPWKLVIEHGAAPRLYRLDRDLPEKHDLARSDPQQVQELLAKLADWERQFEKP